MPRLIQKNVVLTPAVYFSAHAKPVASAETAAIGIVLRDIRNLAARCGHLTNEGV